jgi:hypothetical protein
MINGLTKLFYIMDNNSGILNLVSKPLNNLLYIVNILSSRKTVKLLCILRVITFTSIIVSGLYKSSQIPMFLTSCENLSIDKVVNISNMDYSSRSFKKAPLRAKELRVRHILDNTSSIHLVSQFILTPAQISYK